MRAFAIEQPGDKEREAAGDPEGDQQAAAQLARAPDDLVDGDDRQSLRFVLRHEEVVRDEPPADHDATEKREREDRCRRIKGDARDGTSGGSGRVAAAPARPDRGGERRIRHGPRLIANQTRQGEDDANPRRLRVGVSAPPHQQRDAERREAEKQRLGHRRRLQVDHVRIEREHGGGGERSRCRFCEQEDDPGDGGRRERERGDRDRDGGSARPIEHVDLDGQHVEQVRQRQPHGPDLLPARCDAVDDPPRDDQMAAGVVVAQREPESMVSNRRDHADRRGGRSGEELHTPLLRKVSSVRITVGQR